MAFVTNLIVGGGWGGFTWVIVYMGSRRYGLGNGGVLGIWKGFFLFRIKGFFYGR